MTANETFQDHAEMDDEDEYSRRELEADLTNIETLDKPIILKRRASTGGPNKLRVTKTATPKNQWRMLHYDWNSFACNDEPKVLPVPRFGLAKWGWVPLVPGYEDRMFGTCKDGFAPFWAVYQIGTTRYFDGFDGPILDSLDEWRSWTAESQHTYNFAIPTWRGRAADVPRDRCALCGGYHNDGCWLARPVH